MKKPITLYFLLLLLALQGISAIAGGWVLVTDSSGVGMQLSIAYLEHSPFADYLIPGLVLGIVLGIIPLVLAYALIWRPSWKWPEVINVYKDQYWAWTLTAVFGLVLVLWIDFEILWVSHQHWLQFVYSVLGVAVTSLSLLPKIKEYYKR
jgi:hypothetical protein